MFVKRCFYVFWAAMMMFAVVACGRTVNQPQPETATVQSQNSVDATVSSTANADMNDESVAQKTAGAQLYQLNLKDGESPMIRGLALDGNRAGKSIEEGGHVINGRPLSDNNIRFVFELNEWISFRLDTDPQNIIYATIVPHVDDPATLTDSFMDNVSDASPRLELRAPEEAEAAMASWGETYLHPDDWQPGDYDLVFLSGNTPIARVFLKFYAETELENKTDAQLNKLMQNP